MMLADVTIKIAHFVVAPLPNITNVFYGPDVGYGVERIRLSASS
jgi:hypothetical protein